MTSTTDQTQTPASFLLTTAGLRAQFASTITCATGSTDSTTCAWLHIPTDHAKVTATATQTVTNTHSHAATRSAGRLARDNSSRPAALHAAVCSFKLNAATCAHFGVGGGYR